MIGWLSTRLHRKLTAAFVALILLPTAIIVIYILDRTGEIMIDTARSERLRATSVRASTVVRSLTDISSDLQFVGRTPIVRHYLNAHAGAERASAGRDVERLFVAFLARWADKYSRMCLLDSTGREIDCVQAAGGVAQAVPAHQLTNRRAQPFFTEAMSLRAAPGQPQPIYISDVELRASVAGAAPAATLRYAVALQTDAGVLDAVLVLDALVAPILRLLELSSDAGSTYVVDRPDAICCTPIRSCASLTCTGRPRRCAASARATRS